MDKDLAKTLTEAIDLAVAELYSVTSLRKGEVNLAETKIGDGETNGKLPGDTSSGSVLTPDGGAKKTDDEDADDKDPPMKAPFPPKKEGEDDKDEDDEDDKEDDKEEDDDEDEMSEDDAQKMEEKLSKWKAKKAICKSEKKSDKELIKALVSKGLEAASSELTKSVEARLTEMQGLLTRLANAPAPRKSVSGAAPLAKSEELESSTQALSKAEVMNKLLDLQKSGDTRVDSKTIIRFDLGDFGVLAEKGIIIK
jgi:hypothetical protein